MTLNKIISKVAIALLVSILIVFTTVTFYIWSTLNSAELCKVVVLEIQTRWVNSELDMFEIKYLIIFNNTLPYSITINRVEPVTYVYGILLDFPRRLDAMPIMAHRVLDAGETDTIRFSIGTNNYELSEVIKRYIEEYGEVIPVNYTFSVKYNCSAKILGLYTLTSQKTFNCSGILMVNISKYHPWNIEAFWYPSHVEFGEEAKLYVIVNGPINGTIVVVIIDRSTKTIVKKYEYTIALNEIEHKSIVVPFKPPKPHTKYHVKVFLNGERVFKSVIDLTVT